MEKIKIKKLSWYLLVIGLCVLALIGIIRFGSLFAFFMVFPWIGEQVVAATGIDARLANFMAIPAAIYMVIAVALMFSFKSFKRHLGFGLFVAGLLIWNLAMFTVSKNDIFDPKGASKKCVAKNTNGVYEYEDCGRKVHRLYGTEVVPATKELVALMQFQKNGIPAIQRIKPDRNMRFFAQDGSPFVWYYQYQDGRIELFGQPGSHPQLKVVLNPINSQTASLVLDHIDKGNWDMIVVDHPLTKGEGQTGRSEDKKAETEEFTALKELVKTLSTKTLK